MKQHRHHVTAKRPALIALLFLFIALLSFNSQIYGQGWTFTCRIQAAGPCFSGSNVVAEANAAIAAAGNLRIPTQSQCEAMRQPLVGFSASSGPLYDANGNYLGTCTASIVCGPCTGSDISSGSNPGDVNFNSSAQGQAPFTEHQSSAFEDWATAYKQQLASYGITSFLGNKLTAPIIPLTGNNADDKAFAEFANGFNPDIPATSAKPPVLTPSDPELRNTHPILPQSPPITNSDDAIVPSTNLSPDEIKQDEPPLSTTDKLSLLQTAADLFLEEGTVLKSASGVAGAALGGLGFGGDLNDIYNNPNIGLNSKTLYQLSNAVGDAGLVIGGIGLAATAATVVVFGAPIAVGAIGVSALDLAGTTVVLALAKYYVNTNKPFDTK